MRFARLFRADSESRDCDTPSPCALARGSDRYAQSCSEQNRTEKAPADSTGAVRPRKLLARRRSRSYRIESSKLLATARKIREVRTRVSMAWRIRRSVRAVAQLGRAPGSGPGGRGFKSHQPDENCLRCRGVFLGELAFVREKPARDKKRVEI